MAKVEVTPLWVITASAQSLYLLFSWVFTVHTIYSIATNWKQYGQAKSTAILAIMSMVSFSGCMPGCLSTILSVFGDNPELHATKSIYAAYLCFNFGKIFMYLLFLTILDYAFKDTPHKLRPCTKMVYIIFSVVIPVCTIIIDSIGKWVATAEQDHTLDLVERFLEHGNSMILSMFAACLFVRGLYFVAWNRVNQDRTDEKALRTAKQFLDLFVKYTILVLMLFVFGVIILAISLLIYDNNTLGMKPETFFAVIPVFYYTDCFINILCVYLRFNYASPVYHALCGCCHKCTRLYVTKWMSKRGQNVLPMMVNMQDRMQSARSHSTLDKEETQASV